MLDAGLDVGIADQFSGSGFDVFDAESCVEVGGGDVVAGGAEGGEGFVFGIGESEHGGGSCWRLMAMVCSVPLKRDQL
jgi:hypothetical protein